MSHPISFSEFENAADVLKDVILDTTCEYSSGASKFVGSPVHLKFENQQLTGSFKIRGAYNKIHSLSDEDRARGIIACSAGNHAQGVAYSARALGAKSHIVMPDNAPIAKVEATKNYGAEVHLHGEAFDEAYEFCKTMQKEKGYEFVHPYEDEKVIAGQGTLGLDIYRQVKNLSSVIVGVGGGGLASGVALALKTINPKIKIYGAVAESAPGMYHLFKGSKEQYSWRPTIADGIAIKKPSMLMYEKYLNKYLDDLVCVSDEEMAEAMVFLLERAKAVVEGSGAAGLAAAKKASNWDLGDNCCVILCGGNIDINLIATVIEKGLAATGRTVRIEVAVDDLPGNLARLTNIIADCHANVLHVNHSRVSSFLGLRETLIEFAVSTRDQKHIDEIIQKFGEVGARVLRTEP